MRAIAVLCSLLFLLGCDRLDSKNQASETPDSSVYYSYYERFGFTDVCEHTRLVSRVEGFLADDGWKKLPMDEKVQGQINSMSNKVDPMISRNTVDVFYKNQQAFTDIGIEQNEFKRNGFRDSIFDIREGFYLIEKNCVKFYIPSTKLFYQECHSCNQ